MSAAKVLENLKKNHVGKKYVWQAAGGGKIHHWLTSGTQGDKPDIASGGLACFHLPLMAAIETGDFTWEQAGALIFAQAECGFTKKFPKEWAPNGTTRYYYGTVATVPIRAVQDVMGGAPNPSPGDVVFFSAPGAEWFAHVAVATGNGSETISFGHGADLLGGKALPVEKRTIQQCIADFGGKINKVEFGTPPW